MNRLDYDYLFKLLLIGDSGVGKSCVLLRFVDNAFSKSYISTIGVDFKIRTVIIDGKVIKLQIWDTAGQERFRTITSSYYRGAHGILLVYDITDRISFANLPNWLSELKKYASNNVSTILVGNKCDLSHKRLVSLEEATKFATDHNLKLFETSAKKSENIEKLFIEFVKQIQKEWVNSEVNNSILQKNSSIKVDKKNNCCCI